MGAPKDTLCFTCGLPVADPPRFNHLPNGRSCPTCRDRLLESLPAPLPGKERAAPRKGGSGRARAAAKKRVES